MHLLSHDLAELLIKQLVEDGALSLLEADPDAFFSRVVEALWATVRVRKTKRVRDADSSVLRLR